MPHAPRSTVLRAAWAGSVLLLALAGCGTETPDAQRVGRSVAEQGTWNENTLVPAMKAAVEEHRTVHFTMTTAGRGEGMAAEGDLAFRGRRTDMTLTMDGAPFGADRVEVRVVDGTVYLSMPPMTPRGRFFEVPPGGVLPLAGVNSGVRGADPRDVFEAFESGLRKLTYVEETTTSGERVEHYRVTVDFKEAAKAQGLPRGHGMPRRAEYDLWLDEEALVRRMQLDLPKQTTLAVEMSRWGRPVTIEAPPAGKVGPTPGE